MARRDQRYRLPRNWIVIPLIVYTIVFSIISMLIALSMELFSGYMSSLKARTELDNTQYYVLVYDTLCQEDLVVARNHLIENCTYEFFITDKDMNVIYPKDKELTLTKNTDEEEKEKRFSVASIRFSEEETDFEGTGFNFTIGEEVKYYPDKETGYVNISDDTIVPDLMKILSADGLFKDIMVNGGQYVTPYWIAFEVNNGTEKLLFKTYAAYSREDFVYFALYFALTNLIADSVFVILVVNLIRTHKNNRKMRKLVFKDNITGDRNWFWFAMKSKELIKKRKGNTQYAVISLVFVRYRNYVLCHSLDAGEEILRNIVNTIDVYLDKGEICAYSTTSNFPILLKASSEEEVRARLEKIIKSLVILGGNHDFKFQAGVCMIDPKIRKNADIDLLYNNASSARMTLEDSSDNGIAFFGEKLVEDEKWIDKVTERQREAIEAEEFKVYYQPKYDPRTDELMGAEALIRWFSDKMGFVSPGQFIPIFESSGFITEIDDYMIRHVARDQKRWIDEGRKCVPVSVNVSRAHFAETNLADQIRDIVDEEGAPHDLIEIELTESAFFDDKKIMLTTVRKLKEYGFLVSMDDFGSGYSSLNSLKDMPLDILKLDAGFFRSESDDDGRSKIVVSEALQLARKLDMITVAEGVEEKEQVDFLAKEGCSMIQGYFYAKPMPKEEYELRLVAQKAESAPEEKPEET